jgi:hypothetical protein
VRAVTGGSEGPLRIISLGAGVQSSAMYLLACEGELGRVDAAVFADTGWEPSTVYSHLDRLNRVGGRRVPIYRVTGGNIRDTKRQVAYRDLPYFVKNSDGTVGISRRQCTGKLKIAPIRRRVSCMLSDRQRKKAPDSTEAMLGISLDEVERMKDSDVQWVSNSYPLIDRRWTRADCASFLAERDLSAPRSACIGCPFHSDAEWRRMKRERPADFEDAVQFEREVQNSPSGLKGKPFLHRSCAPLGEVDFSNAEDRGQLSFLAECEGMCGV